MENEKIEVSCKVIDIRINTKISCELINSNSCYGINVKS